jgi:hypothetical protein
MPLRRECPDEWDTRDRTGDRIQDSIQVHNVDFTITSRFQQGDCLTRSCRHAYFLARCRR